MGMDNMEEKGLKGGLLDKDGIKGRESGKYKR